MTAPSRQSWLPRFMDERDRRGWLGSLVAGSLLAAPALVLASVLSRDTAFGFLAILLGMIASVYLGFALQDGRRHAFQIENAAIFIFAAVATVALAEKSAVLLAAGYFGHGLWDVIHHPRGIDTAIPWWYVPLCLSADTVIAIYILIRFG